MWGTCDRRSWKSQTYEHTSVFHWDPCCSASEERWSLAWLPRDICEYFWWSSWQHSRLSRDPSPSPPSRMSPRPGLTVSRIYHWRSLRAGKPGDHHCCQWQVSSWVALDSEDCAETENWRLSCPRLRRSRRLILCCRMIQWEPVDCDSSPGLSSAPVSWICSSARAAPGKPGSWSRGWGRRGCPRMSSWTAS